MKNARLILFAIALSLHLFFLLPGQLRAASTPRFKVGVASRSFVPAGSYNWRGAKTHALITTIWYPAAADSVEKAQWIGSPDSPFAIAGHAALDASLSAKPAKFPLILLSHGTGASSLMMGWLGTALASRGYIAAAVNHPGNNSLEDYTVQGFSFWWERATDISTLLDQLLADPLFGARIDSKRVGAAGFSLGGFTMFELAGGIGQLSSYQDFCKSPRADGMCVAPAEFPNLSEKVSDLAKTDPEFQASLRDAARSHADARIRAVFAFAPALGPAFAPASLERISVPVYIAAGEADTVVPVETSAKFFAAHIPGAKLTLFRGVGHYTFLATCAEFGRRARPDLCLDPAGILRDEIHTQAADLALQFFSANLK
jgi:predicted dienelactone hydrolase